MKGVFDHMQNYVARIEKETGHSIVTLRSNNDGKTNQQRWSCWKATNSKNKGIRHESSATETPKQNGVAERYNRHSTLIE